MDLACLGLFGEKMFVDEKDRGRGKERGKRGGRERLIESVIEG